MRSGPALLALTLALGAPGCYLSFELGDGGAAGDGPAPVDGARLDAGHDAPNVDAGPCFTARGVEICNTSECPSRAEGGCWSCTVNEDREGPGFCIQPGETGSFRGGDGAAPCTLGDTMLFYPWRDFHNCARPLACLEIQDAGWGRCFYADGTEARTAAVAPAGTCRGIEDLACGPACRTCPADHDCLGPSEASGLGYCVPADEIFFDRNWCGYASLRDERRECGRDEGCLRFVTSPSPDFPEDEIVGECFRRSDCERLATARPDRFRCE